MHLEAVQVLLKYNAGVNSQDNFGGTPLFTVCLQHRDTNSEAKVVDIIRPLLEHEADPNICNSNHSTPLHLASSKGLLEVTRLLLSFGGKVNEKDKKGRTPFQLATLNGYEKLTKLLLEHGAEPQL